jgi:hypothetical protein
MRVLSMVVCVFADPENDREYYMETNSSRDLVQYVNVSWVGRIP